MKTAAVLLAGCGHADGSEIQESVSVLIALSKYHIEYDCFSIDAEQFDVIDHFKKSPMQGRRNLLVEAARIARGDIRDISQLDPNDYDALIIPGGLGIAKNLFTYATEGINGRVAESVKEVIQSFYEMNKYIGAVCISPIMVVMALKDDVRGLRITPGFAQNAAADLEKIGAVTVPLPSNEICVDEINNIVTTPAYMNGKVSLYEVYEGIEKLVEYIAGKI
jgi:enhancing lycopene biosynthesis protein 2